MPDQTQGGNDGLGDAADAARRARDAIHEDLATNVPARLDAQPSTLMPAPSRGVTAAHVEGAVGLAPPAALEAVREAIERETTLRGHLQGDAEADIVDERQGLTYRLRTQDDGQGTALVRVDVDPSDRRGQHTLKVAGLVGISGSLALLGWWLSTSVLLVAVGIGTLGGLLLWRGAAALRTAIEDARRIAAQALGDAERTAPIGGALPPGAD